MASTTITIETQDNTFSVVKKLLSEVNSDSHHSILLQLFVRHGYNVPLSKRQIEKELGLTLAFRNVQFGEGIMIHNLQELIQLASLLPGDLQRDLRTFHDKYKNYGLQRTGEGKTIQYSWTPITEEEYNWIQGTPIVPRSIFNTEEERFTFVLSKRGMCEICDNKDRLAIDHWRAHSIYNIDTPNIAVLLCEQCNNIHHNHDASTIILKKKGNIQCIKNWIAVEKRIRENGYMPNEKDIQTQNEHIDAVFKYYLETIGHEFTDLLSMKL